MGNGNTNVGCKQTTAGSARNYVSTQWEGERGKSQQLRAGQLHLARRRPPRPFIITVVAAGALPLLQDTPHLLSHPNGAGLRSSTRKTLSCS